MNGRRRTFILPIWPAGLRLLTTRIRLLDLYASHKLFGIEMEVNV